MFQFPASPTIGQVFEPLTGLKYTWNGKGWVPPSFSTATTPILHADGTLAAPGISWVNETNAGFRRVSTGTFQSVVGGNWIYGWNSTGFTLNTGVGFYAGAATFSGNVTGITNAMVGLGNVVNNQQIWNYAPGNASIQMAWTGSALAYSLNSGGGSTTWPIDITGSANGNAYGYANRALRVHHGANPGSGSIAFHWSGQGGTPQWVWGSPDDPSNSYVYSPANFTVNYAHGAGNANRAAYVSNAANHSSTGFVFHWHDPGWQLNYLWGSNDGTNMYLQNRGAMNVSYANSTNDSTHHEGHRVWQLCRSLADWNYAGCDGNNNNYPRIADSNRNGSYCVTGWDHTFAGGKIYFNGEHYRFQVWGDNGYHELNLSIYSDERLKENIEDSPVDATAIIKQMRMIKFKWTLGNEVNIGFTAQNLQRIDPQMVTAVKQEALPEPPPEAPPLPDPPAMLGLDEVLSVNTDKILAYTVKSLQELIARVEQLEAK